jgi:hypothetical protein
MEDKSAVDLSREGDGKKKSNTSEVDALHCALT